MEDTHFLLPRMDTGKDIYVFGIFDGHRGAAAAQFSAHALLGFLQNLSSTRSSSDELVEAFLRTDDAFRNALDSHRKSKRVTQKNWYPGCIAIVALIARNELFVANVGDCRAILCRGQGAYALSKVVSKTNDSTGDGTTTTSFRAQEIIKLGLLSVTSGANPVSNKNSIDKTVHGLVEELEKKSRSLKGLQNVYPVIIYVKLCFVFEYYERMEWMVSFCGYEPCVSRMFY